jgi:hypothetical protein
MVPALPAAAGSAGMRFLEFFAANETALLRDAPDYHVERSPSPASHGTLERVPTF